MEKSIDESILFWKKHYHHVKDQVDRIDKGEEIRPTSLDGMQVGQRQHCVDQANMATERLATLGNFDLPKIK